MNDDIESDLFLQLNAFPDLVLVKFCVLFLALETLLELQTVLPDVSCLREGADGCCREKRKSELFLLKFFSLFELRESFVVFGLNRRNGCLYGTVLVVFPAGVKDLVFDESLVLLKIHTEELAEFPELRKLFICE